MKNILLFLVILLLLCSSPRAQVGWGVQAIGTSNQLTSVYFPTPTTGYIAGWYSTLFKTTNSGLNWIQIPMSGSVGYQCVYFVSPDLGWVLGQSGTILCTTNSGVNWFTQSSGTTSLLLLAQFLSPQVGYVVGYNGTILKTLNGGLNWFLQSSGTTANLVSEYFINSQTGVISGDYGTILKTTNGGSNWISIPSGTTSNLGKIQFVNDLTGWCAVGNGQILKTTNGGSVWFFQQSGTSTYLNTVTFVDENTGWITGNGGMIMKTLNGGTNWYQQPTNVTNDLRSNFCVNQNTGWVVGAGGIVLKTTNGGESIPAAPVLISPANNSFVVSTTPVMMWTSASGATRYHIQISTTNSFSVITDSATVLLTNYTVPAGKLSVNGSYYWRVRGINSTGTGNWSNVWMFTVNNNLQIPILLYPLNASIVYTNTPLLDWEDCSGSINYNVQISINSNFNTILDSSTVTNSSYIVPSGKLFPGNPYFWRVKARYSGGESNWSSVRYFNVEPNGITQINNEMPKEYRLYQNYPNPFNPSTKIKFEIASNDNVDIKIYNSIGQLVEYVFSGNLSAGTYILNWNAKNMNSGIYFIRLVSSNYSITKRMLLIK